MTLFSLFTMAEKNETQGTLDTAVLCNELISISDWRILGLNLGVRDYELDQIQRNYPTEGCSRWRQETFTLWLRCTPSASWENVVKALRQMGENKVAADIELKYISRTGPPTSTTNPVSPTEDMSTKSVFAFQNREAIKGKFANFQRKVCNKLFKKQVDINQFLLFVINFFPGYCIPRPPTDFTEVFAAITNHGLWSYFHYSPLVEISKEFCGSDPEMEAMAKQYRKDLKSYNVVAKIEDFIESEPDAYTKLRPEEQAKNDPHYFRPVEWKTDFVDHSLKHLSDVWEVFSAQYLVPDSPPTALLDRIRKGCVSITWLVPSSLIPQLIKTAKTETAFFQEHRILKVTVGDQCVYEEEISKDSASDDPSDSEGESGADCFSETFDSAQQSEGFPPSGYECEIVESPPWAADFPTNCPICLHVLHNPQLTAECGHTFCKACITRAQASKRKKCPECNRTEVSIFPHESLRRLLNNLQVRCTFQNEERICNWTGKLREFEKHLNLNPTCEDELLTGCELVAIQCKFSYAGCKAQMPRKDMANHMKEEQPHHIELLAMKVKKQNGKLKKQNRELERLAMKLRSKDEETAQIIHQIQEESTLKLQSKDDEIDNITRKMKEIEAKLQSRDEEIAQIMPEKRHLVQPIPVHYCFTMDKFKSRKRKNTEWFSDPFYTHQQGYKMCVRIDANGYRESRGTHVSLYTCIMRGEYDDELPWPFHGKITVELLNQNADRHHHEYTISYSEGVGPDYAARVRTGKKNQGWGNPQFFSHLDLKLRHKSDPTVQYLKDDCLKIRIREVLLYNVETPLPVCVANVHSI